MNKYALFICVLLCMAPVVSAAHFMGDKASGITIPSGTIVTEDVYAAAKDISLAGAVNADATVAGETVTLAGTLQEDFIAVGRTISVSGSVGHDVRVAGQNITVSGVVHGDVIAFGETLTIAEGSVIDGDVLFFGRSATLLGEVKKEVHMWSADVSLVNAKTGAITAHTGALSLTNTTVVGDVKYYSNNELLKDTATTISGTVTRVPVPIPVDEPESPFDDISFGFMLMMLAMTALAVWLFADASTRAVTLATQRPWRNLIIGFLGIIGIPIISIMLLVTVIGLPLGFLMLFLYGAVLIVAKVLGGILAGALLARLIKKEYIVSYLWAGAGVIALAILPIIPLVGWVPGAACFIAMVGVLLRSGEHILFKRDSE